MIDDQSNIMIEQMNQLLAINPEHFQTENDPDLAPPFSDLSATRHVSYDALSQCVYSLHLDRNVQKNKEQILANIHATIFKDIGTFLEQETSNILAADRKEDNPGIATEDFSITVLDRHRQDFTPVHTTEEKQAFKDYQNNTLSPLVDRFTQSTSDGITAYKDGSVHVKKSNLSRRTARAGYVTFMAKHMCDRSTWPRDIHLSGGTSQARIAVLQSILRCAQPVNIVCTAIKKTPEEASLLQLLAERYRSMTTTRVEKMTRTRPSHVQALVNIDQILTSPDEQDRPLTELAQAVQIAIHACSAYAAQHSRSEPDSEHPGSTRKIEAASDDESISIDRVLKTLNQVAKAIRDTPGMSQGEESEDAAIELNERPTTLEQFIGKNNQLIEKFNGLPKAYIQENTKETLEEVHVAPREVDYASLYLRVSSESQRTQLLLGLLQPDVETAAKPHEVAEKTGNHVKLTLESIRTKIKEQYNGDAPTMNRQLQELDNIIEEHLPKSLFPTTTLNVRKEARSQHAQQKQAQQDFSDHALGNTFIDEFKQFYTELRQDLSEPGHGRSWQSEAYDDQLEYYANRLARYLKKNAKTLPPQDRLEYTLALADLSERLINPNINQEHSLDARQQFANQAIDQLRFLFKNDPDISNLKEINYWIGRIFQSLAADMQFEQNHLSQNPMGKNANSLLASMGKKPPDDQINEVRRDAAYYLEKAGDHPGAAIALSTVQSELGKGIHVNSMISDLQALQDKYTTAQNSSRDAPDSGGDPLDRSALEAKDVRDSTLIRLMNSIRETIKLTNSLPATEKGSQETEVNPELAGLLQTCFDDIYNGQTDFFRQTDSDDTQPHNRSYYEQRRIRILQCIKNQKREKDPDFKEIKRLNQIFTDDTEPYHAACERFDETLDTLADGDTPERLFKLYALMMALEGGRENAEAINDALDDLYPTTSEFDPAMALRNMYPRPTPGIRRATRNDTLSPPHSPPPKTSQSQTSSFLGRLGNWFSNWSGDRAESAELDPNTKKTNAEDFNDSENAIPGTVTLSSRPRRPDQASPPRSGGEADTAAAAARAEVEGEDRQQPNNPSAPHDKTG